MKFKILALIITTLISFPATAGNDPTEPPPIPLELRYLDDGKILLYLNNTAIELKEYKSGWLLPLEKQLHTISTDLNLLIQVMHQYHQSGGSTSMRRMQYKLERLFEKKLRKSKIIELMIEAAVSTRKPRYLIQLLRHTTNDTTISRIYFYLFQLADKWLDKRFYLRKALELTSPNSDIFVGAQYFSLMVAKGVLQAYKKNLLKVGILRKIDMEGVEPTVTDAIWEAIFNTANAAKLCLTHHADYLLTEWEAQLLALQRLINAINTLTLNIERNEKPLSLSLMNHTEPEIQKGLNILKQTSFLQDLITHGTYNDTFIAKKHIPFPMVEQLGLRKNIDFITYDWRTILWSEVSLFNYWMLFRLPKQIEMAYATERGKRIFTIFRLNNLIEKFNTYSKYKKMFWMWFTFDFVLDGCVFRYTYIAIKTYFKLDLSEEDEIEKLIQKQFD